MYIPLFRFVINASTTTCFNKPPALLLLLPHFWISPLLASCLRLPPHLAALRTAPSSESNGSGHKLQRHTLQQPSILDKGGQKNK